MIISASRRTDIPACYADWFIRRLSEGFVFVRNPMRYHSIGKIALTPDVVDGVVLWTKNPLPLMGRLDALRDYAFYFHFTLTPYGADVEPNVPPKDEVIVPAFLELARRIGKERVVWRYDPILFSDVHTAAYHVERFKSLAGRLAGSTGTCTVSFLDFYRGMKGRVAPLGVIEPPAALKEDLLGRFSEIAKAAGISLDACAEGMDFTSLGVGRACTLIRRIERIGGLGSMWTGQKPSHCSYAPRASTSARTTPAGRLRLYCYATHGRRGKRRQHDPPHPPVRAVRRDDVVTSGDEVVQGGNAICSERGCLNGITKSTLKPQRAFPKSLYVRFAARGKNADGNVITRIRWVETAQIVDGVDHRRVALGRGGKPDGMGTHHRDDKVKSPPPICLWGEKGDEAGTLSSGRRPRFNRVVFAFPAECFSGTGESDPPLKAGEINLFILQRLVLREDRAQFLVCKVDPLAVLGPLQLIGPRVFRVCTRRVHSVSFDVVFRDTFQTVKRGPSFRYRPSNIAEMKPYDDG